MNELVVHALLSLYGHIAYSKTFVPVKKRNEYLVKFIKARQKRPQFKMCKKEMKTMLAIGRQAQGNLEDRLWELNQLNLAYRAQFSQADELYVLFNRLYEEWGFQSQLSDHRQTVEPETLYMASTDIEAGFDEDNRQIIPLKFSVKTDRLDTLMSSIQEEKHYRVEVVDVDEQGEIHLLLHRANG